MDIPNLSQNNDSVNQISSKPKKFPIVFVIIVVFAIICGFWISRFWPSQKAVSLSDIDSTNVVGSDSISPGSLKVGVVYGDIEKTFKDTATGVIEKGNINGEGTHILNREGGVTQRASLTSSTVDLDLFIGKKVEIKGETNASNKTAWLMDVGSIKILE